LLGDDAAENLVALCSKCHQKVHLRLECNVHSDESLRLEPDSCEVLQQWRGTQRYRPTQRADEDALTEAILILAIEYGRYPRITVELRKARWPVVGKDRVQRMWRREGLKLPQNQRPRGRSWLR